MTFWVVPGENFREQRNIWKGSPVFPDRITKRKFVPSRSFFGKWNWFVQTVNASPEWNLPVLNFTYHLPKPWIDRFVHGNGKQPLSSTVIKPFHRLIRRSRKCLKVSWVLCVLRMRAISISAEAIFDFGYSGQYKARSVLSILGSRGRLGLTVLGTLSFLLADGSSTGPPVRPSTPQGSQFEMIHFPANVGACNLVLHIHVVVN